MALDSSKNISKYFQVWRRKKERNKNKTVSEKLNEQFLIRNHNLD